VCLLDVTPVGSAELSEQFSEASRHLLSTFSLLSLSYLDLLD